MSEAPPNGNPVQPLDKQAQALENQARYLGKLIFGLNPYTNREMPNTSLEAGEMQIFSSSPEPGAGVSATPNVSQIAVEMDGPYRQEWTFKGTPQKVGMAYRVKYKFPVYRNNTKGKELMHWVEDYILIGFEGGMGG